MATVPETQALIAELGAPTITTPAALRQAIAAFAPSVGEAIQEAGLLGQLAQSSELTEPDAQLVGLYGTLFQQIGAMRRIAGELERDTRQLAACMADLVAVAQQIKTRAAALGYTTT